MNQDLTMDARFRFAPSPTGNPHVGSLHTALFSWALARAMDGAFILRIDDTDQARNSAETVTKMIAALHWLGVEWDEGPDIGGDYGPYSQSQRTERYAAVAQKLLAGDHAYYGTDDSQGGRPLFLRMPQTGQTIFQDALRGDIVFENSTQKDTLLVRSDGTVLYHLANAVDDHDMGITHAVRGEDWISSAPLQVAIYRALGWQEPIWVHVPFILNKDRQKLSKRDPEGGYLVRDFQQAGYLPQALFNYLLLLGWSPDGEQEIVDKWTVRKQFRLERLSASAAIFDWDKLNWVNQHYMKKLSAAQLADLLRDPLEDAYGTRLNKQWLEDLTVAVRDELVCLSDVVDAAEWAFDPVPDTTAEAQEALNSPVAMLVLVHLSAEITTLVLLDKQTALMILKTLRQRLKSAEGWDAQTIFHPIRAALTGTLDGPPVHEILGILGKQRSLERMARTIKQ